MAKTVKTKLKDSREVILSGSLVLSSAGDIRAQLLQALDESDIVHLMLQDVTEVDLSLVQIICAAHRSALQRKKSLVLQKDLPDSFVQIIEDAGLQDHIGCSSGTRENCVWHI